jgi:hypothetical protein
MRSRTHQVAKACLLGLSSMILSGCLPIWHGTFFNTLDVPIQVQMFGYPSNSLVSEIWVDAHESSRGVVTLGRMVVRSSEGKKIGELHLTFSQTERQTYTSTSHELWFLITRKGAFRVPVQYSGDWQSHLSEIEK